MPENPQNIPGNIPAARKRGRPSTIKPGLRRFKLVVLGNAPATGNGSRKLLARCDCGNTREVHLSAFSAGKVKACKHCSKMGRPKKPLCPGCGRPLPKGT